MNKTYSLKPSEVKRQWLLIDASELTLGRISTVAANLLLGKNKPSFTSHIDGGDYVVIVNAAKIKVTGNKLLAKKYYRHSQYPGGLHERTLGEQLQLDPSKVLIHSIKGMLPANKLLDDRLKRLKVYADENHNHSAQQPTKIDLKKGNA
jgi:large subunit ribosomal protein L13